MTMTASTWLLGGLAALAMISVGSFTNVIIARMPVPMATPNEFGERWATRPWSEVLGGTSHCDSCDIAIAPQDNIPLVSYVLLRGRCRGCATPIPRFHPLVELLVPALAAVVLLTNGWSATSLVLLLAIPSTVAIAAIDQRTFLVPTKLVWPTLAVVALASAAVFVSSGHRESLAGCLIGSLAMAGPLGLTWLVAPSAMGFGDVRLAVVLGWLVGVAFAPLGVLEGLMLAMVVLFLSSLGLVLMALITGQARRGSRLAFGPALIAGTWTLVCCAPLLSDGPLATVLLPGRTT
jgi:leader peptidase (prepilin peptidase)/N-methyltransferase